MTKDIKESSNYLSASLLTLLVAFGSFIFGWDTGTISGFVNDQDFIRRFGKINPSTNAYELSDLRTGLIVSIFNIGCAFGGLFLSKTGDYWGRKKGLFITMIVYIVGIVIQMSSAWSWIQYFVGRIVAGLAVGSISVLCPMFISETAPKAIRGALVSSYQLMVTAGIFIGYCVDYGVYHNFTDSRQWRIPLGLGFLWALLMITGMAFMPESPRYLVSIGYPEHAKVSISKINGTPTRSDFTIKECRAIENSVQMEKEIGSASWKEMITGKPKIFYRLWIGIILQSLQQLTGCNYFFYYGTTIFKSVGLDDSFTTSIILGAINFASSFIALYTIDKMGRRKVLIIGAAGMAICEVVYAAIGSQLLYPKEFGVNPNQQVGNTMIVFACLFIFFFAVTWGPGVFVVVSETYPLRIKSKGMGLAQSANWLWNFFIAFFTPRITNSIHFSYGYVFFGCNVFALFFVLFFVPETKDFSLEMVDSLYESYQPGPLYLKKNRFARKELLEHTPEPEILNTDFSKLNISLSSISA